MRPAYAALTLIYVTISISPSLDAQLRGVPVGNIDRTANACTDFDAYANGHWRAENPMPCSPVSIVSCENWSAGPWR